MSGDFSDHFSGVAHAYKAFRPSYPEALFDWLAKEAPGRDLAIDLGCGSGQATIALARCFRSAIGVEPSAEQVARAEPHPSVEYRVARAEATGLPDRCADLVIAAQALHWFDPAPLERELSRIARPGAVFAAFSYALCRVAPAVDTVVDHLYREIVGPHWPPERAHVDSGYRTLPFPWPEIAPPPLAMAEAWTFERFVGNLGTWSAVSRYRQSAGADPLALVVEALRTAWGAPEQTRTVTWNLSVRAGRVNAPPP